MKTAPLLLGAALLGGCGSLRGLSGDPFEPIPVAPDAPQKWAAAGVDTVPAEGDWLAQFNSAPLNGLVQEALANNPTLASQVATRNAAVFDARAERGNLRPLVNGSADAGVLRNVANVGGDAVTSDDTLYGLGVSASWDADLWGRLRAGVRLADSELAVAEADLQAARLSLAAQTAFAWLDLNTAQALEQVADATLEVRQRTERLTTRRFSRGLSTALDVRLARSAVAQAEATIAQREQATGEAARRLEVLIGRYPAAEVDAPAQLPRLSPLQPSGNPVTLLARRPDVAAAEARVISAGLRAEQARLALYPSLTLTASASTSQNDLADALDPAFIAARAIAGLAQPLYAGGQIAARRDAFIERAKIALANYAATTLTAWQEVENALAADGFLARQEDAQERALEEAAQAEDLAERQYQNGLVSIFNLIDAQTRRLNSESALVSARAARASNRISYHLALGGGVPVAMPNDPSPARPSARSPSEGPQP